MGLALDPVHRSSASHAYVFWPCLRDSNNKKWIIIFHEDALLESISTNDKLYF